MQQKQPKTCLNAFVMFIIMFECTTFQIFAKYEDLGTISM